MITGTIRPLPREEIVSREDTVLPMAWVGLPKAKTPAPNLAWLSTTASPSMSAKADAPLLACLGLDGAEVVLEAVAQAHATRRVYLLVSADGSKLPTELQRAANVLVRRVPEIPASALHAGGEARLWIGGPWTLRLDERQREALRKAFLHLFWHDATEEAWSDGRQLVWRKAADRPFDVPSLPASAPVRLVAADARLENGPRDAVVLLNGGTPPTGPLKQLWFPASGQHQQTLAGLARTGTPVVWDETGLPDLVAGQSGGELLLPGNQGRLRVRLSPEQSAELRQLLESRPPSWQFRLDQRIGEPSVRQAQFWLPGEAKAQTLEAAQKINLGEVPASTLRAVAETRPGSFPKPSPLALSVRHCWTVLPPRLPAASEEDALIKRWREIDETWDRQIKHAQEALDSTEGERGRLGKLFQSLVGALLGFERQQKQLLEQLGALQSRRPSAAGPTEARELFQRLNDLAAQVGKLKGELKEEERRAEEEAERKRQESQWRARVEAARQALPDKRTELQELEAKRDKIRADLAAVEATLKTADKAADKDAHKDLRTRRHHLNDEQKQTERRIAKTKSEITSLEKSADETFQFVPPPAPVTAGKPKAASGGARFVPESGGGPTLPVFPDEASPAVGQLRSHKNQRYLAIELWDDLASGEPEAARLAAKLVAAQNS